MVSIQERVIVARVRYFKPKIATSYNYGGSLNSKGVHTIQQALGDKSLNHETTVSKNKSEMSLKLIREVLVMAI